MDNGQIKPWTEETNYKVSGLERSTVSWITERPLSLHNSVFTEFKIATLMHAIHQQRGPAYLSNMVQFNTAESGRRQLRSSTTNAAFVVRTRTQFGKWEARLLSLWSKYLEPDSLPHIRNLHSAPAFRKALKTYLFLQL